RSPPLKKPVKIPIKVIPICTVDKKLLGLSFNSNAVLAPAFFSLAACKRAFRLDTMAISDADRIPFRMIKMRIMTISVTISRQIRFDVLKYKKYIHYLV